MQVYIFDEAVGGLGARDGAAEQRWRWEAQGGVAERGGNRRSCGTAADDFKERRDRSCFFCMARSAGLYFLTDFRTRQIA